MRRGLVTTRCGSPALSHLLAGTVLLATVALLAGCTPRAEAPPAAGPAPVADRFQLVAFDSCADALKEIRATAREHVGLWGFGGGARRAVDLAVPETAARAGALAPGSQSAPEHSSTNVHEAGVDEPDLVKTDGRRIVLVRRGLLVVIDPATRQVTGRLDLAAGGYRTWRESNLLLHGDRALILVPEYHDYELFRSDPATPEKVPPSDDRITGPRLILVDLAGPPTVLSEYRIDGALVDARQVDATARIVVRSTPRIDLPQPRGTNDAERLAENRRIIQRADISAWLPRYEVTTGGRTSTGQVDCARLHRPASYSGGSLVTLLSFDLDATTLGGGDPVTVMADGETVYSNGRHLYLASDQRWKTMPVPLDSRPAPTPQMSTELHQFDISGDDRPRYLTSTSVPGWLINQYAMSEWNGHLRVATTVEHGRSGGTVESSSTVYVLRADGRTLTETGRVTGLGRGERIYSVRFTGPTGYVVTFRQTDPLYTVDLRDPAAPKVTGELKITGYSAYLHPIGDDRLLGIGQEATTGGRVQGTQISLFDVADPRQPTRLARHHVRWGHSRAEFDPHAFLYRPAQQLLVVPLVTHDPGRPVGASGALVLRVSDQGLTELGLVQQRRPGTGRSQPVPGLITRTLVVDGVLWSISENIVQANDVATLGVLETLSI